MYDERPIRYSARTLGQFSVINGFTYYSFLDVRKNDVELDDDLAQLAPAVKDTFYDVTNEKSL